MNPPLSVGVALIFPLFQYLNGNDNIIIIASGVCKIFGQLVRALAKTEAVFFSSTIFGTLRLVYNAPVRSQISKFVEPEELGKVNRNAQMTTTTLIVNPKVFAMLGVFEAVVPIIAGGVFTKLYNATAEMDYPWHASFYFGTIGVIAIGKNLHSDTRYDSNHKPCHVLGLFLTIFVFLGSRRQHISTEKIEDKSTEDTKI